MNEYNGCGLRFTANTTIVPICEGQDFCEAPKSLDDHFRLDHGGIFIVVLHVIGLLCVWLCSSLLGA